MDPQVYILPLGSITFFVSLVQKQVVKLFLLFFFSGLGSEKNDICGRDWVHEGGDHGDPGKTPSIMNILTN